MKPTASLLTLVLSVSIGTLLAAPKEGDGPPGGGPEGHHPPPPLISALDADHDGVISSAELLNAPAALKTLDKNGDGKLTMDELRPTPPEGGGGPGGDRPPGGADGKRPAGDGDRPAGDAGKRRGPREGQAEGAPGDGQRRGPRDGQRGAGGPGDGQRRMPPIVAALDADHDGTISSLEMGNATTALKKLDKNGDGQLTADEVRPGPGDGGPGHGPRDGESGKRGPRDGDAAHKGGPRDGDKPAGAPKKDNTQ